MGLGRPLVAVGRATDREAREEGALALSLRTFAPTPTACPARGAECHLSRLPFRVPVPSVIHSLALQASRWGVWPSVGAGTSKVQSPGSGLEVLGGEMGKCWGRALLRGSGLLWNPNSEQVLSKFDEKHLAICVCV